MVKVTETLDMALLQHVQDIEGKKYPEHMQMLQDIDDASGLEEYISGQKVVAITGSTWYCLVSCHRDVIEVADLAGSMSLSDLNQLLVKLKEISSYCHGQIKADLRKKTSFRLVCTAAKRGRIAIHHEESWWWQDEEMVLTKFQIL